VATMRRPDPPCTRPAYQERRRNAITAGRITADSAPSQPSSACRASPAGDPCGRRPAA
jgi:hypothetical protein